MKSCFWNSLYNCHSSVLSHHVVMQYVILLPVVFMLFHFLFHVQFLLKSVPKGHSYASYWQHENYKTQGLLPLSASPNITVHHQWISQQLCESLLPGS